MKPMLADDWEPEKVKFPLIAMPKIDGVRALNWEGRHLSRQWKPHENRFTTQFYSQQFLHGFDGEMAAEAVTHPRLCSLTSSALSTHAGEPYLLWHLFDYVDECLPYIERLEARDLRFKMLKASQPEHAHHLRLVPWWWIKCEEDLSELHTSFCTQGYEGTIIRDPFGLHKQGRSTVREGGYLRIKPFAHDEGIVLDILEGQENGNAATINELGKTKRSTHKANMIPNGMVGTIVVKTVKDIVVNNKTKTIPAGTVFNVSPGKLTHDQRKDWWQSREQKKGLLVKFQHFPIGVKDVPRMGTFHAVRSLLDM